MEEIWKDIPNYEGIYQASNLGNIRVLIFHNNICVKNKIHLLKQQVDKYGRKRVMLYKNGKPKLYQVHTLIANTFLNKNGNLIKTWDKVLDITNTMKISKQSISYCCKGKTKTAGGYIWRYVNE